jgi:hypothetical protein
MTQQLPPSSTSSSSSSNSTRAVQPSWILLQLSVCRVLAEFAVLVERVPTNGAALQNAILLSLSLLLPRCGANKWNLLRANPAQANLSTFVCRG